MRSFKEHSLIVLTTENIKCYAAYALIRICGVYAVKILLITGLSVLKMLLAPFWLHYNNNST